MKNVAFKGVWFRKGATYRKHETNMLDIGYFDGLMSSSNLVIMHAYKNKQTNITNLTLSEYINRNIVVNHVSECVYKVSYQPNCTRLKSRYIPKNYILWSTFWPQKASVYLNHFYIIRPQSFLIRWNYAAVRTITPFKVIQGHQFWYQSKAHIRLHISD